MNKARLTTFTLCALCALIPTATFANVDPGPLTVITVPIEWDDPRLTTSNHSVLLETCMLMLRFWRWLTVWVYVLSACSLALMSFRASILGQFSMGNFITWAAALFVMSMTEPVLAFLTNGSARLGCAGLGS